MLSSLPSRTSVYLDPELISIEFLSGLNNTQSRRQVDPPSIPFYSRRHNTYCRWMRKNLQSRKWRSYSDH